VLFRSKVIAFHRWDLGTATDDVMVVANFSHEAQENYVIGFPAGGSWKLHFNSDWQGYCDDFHDYPSSDVVAETGENDGLPFYAPLSIGPYSVLIYSRSSEGG